MKKRILYAQRQLTKDRYNPGGVDGIMGSNTIAALDRFLGPNDLSPRKKVIVLIQLKAEEADLDIGEIDGLWGPQTDYAFEELLQLEKSGERKLWRPEDLESTSNPNNWPVQGTSNLNNFYGPVGENQIRIDLPYPHKLSWNKKKTINRFSCNVKVHDSMKRVLTKVLDTYGLERIKQLRLDIWGGCLYVRKMRGGSNYSTHSWGIAVDYDPENNRLKWRSDRASFARPEYNDWWRIWEEEGWVGLGRAKDYDWMHIQAARIT